MRTGPDLPLPVSRFLRAKSAPPEPETREAKLAKDWLVRPVVVENSLGAIGACGENVADTENISLFAVVCSSKCGQELFVTVLTVLWLEKLPGPSCRPWVSRDGGVDALKFCVHGPSDHPWTNQSCDDLLYVWGLGINESMQSEQ